MPSSLLYSTPLQRFNNTLLQHSFTTLLPHNSLLQTSLQHSSPPNLYYTLLRHFFRTALQHSSPTLLYNDNTLLQHFATTLISNTSLQDSAPTLLQRFSAKLSSSTSLQHSSPTLLCDALLTSPTLLYHTRLPNASLQHLCTTLFGGISPALPCSTLLNASLQHSSNISTTLLQRFSTKLSPRTSLQHSSPTFLYSDTFLQHFTLILLCNTLPAPFYNTLLQHLCTTLFCNISAQHSSPTLLHNTLLQQSGQKHSSAPCL